MNESHGYSAENILKQLPWVLANDRRMNALAASISSALATHLGELKEEEIYTRIDELPEDLLDILANDFRIEWYNFDYPVVGKRNLIKTNYYVHRHLGTVGAVKEAIRSLYPRSDVEEWWQDWYQGEPFHFRIMLESGYPIIPVAYTDILKAVYIYKSLRSHLDAIVYRTTVIVGVSVSAGFVPYWGRITGTYPDRARQGEIVTGKLSTSASGEGLAYNTRLCGTAPGGIY